MLSVRPWHIFLLKLYWLYFLIFFSGGSWDRQTCLTRGSSATCSGQIQTRRVPSKLIRVLFPSVLGIRDIFVRIRIPGSVPLSNGSVSGSNSVSDSFLLWLWRCQKNFFPHFSNKLPAASLKNLFFCWNFVLQALFQSAQHIYEKREGSGSVPLTNVPGSRRS